MTPYRSPASPEWRPPLAYGGHQWALIVHDGPRGALWWCSGCLSYCTSHELSEGFWRVVAGLHCPGRFRALDRGPAPCAREGIVMPPLAPSDAVGTHQTGAGS